MPCRGLCCLIMTKVTSQKPQGCNLGSILIKWMFILVVRFPNETMIHVAMMENGASRETIAN